MTHSSEGTPSDYSGFDALLHVLSDNNFTPWPEVDRELLERLDAQNPDFAGLVRYTEERMKDLMRERRALDFVRQAYIARGMLLGLLAVQEGLIPSATDETGDQ